jgi:hypothetical protein
MAYYYVLAAGTEGGVQYRGTYNYDSMHNSKPAYKSASGNFYLYHDGGTDGWCLYTSMNDTTCDFAGGDGARPVTGPQGCYAAYAEGFSPSVTEYEIIDPPTVTISAATNIAPTTATINGNVTVTGGENPSVTMYWGETDGLQVTGNWTNNSAPTSPGQPQGVAAFYTNITSLTAGTKYYFSAKATNSGGTGWPAASLNFTTSSNACAAFLLNMI